MSSQEIGTWVRNWVHYDNLAGNLNKQTLNARKMRDKYEQEIISALKRSNMEKAIIKIGGGQLSISHEKSQHPLTLSRIEEITHKYFELRGGQDETEAYMKFLRKNRGTDESVRLKHTNTLPPAQAPAALL